VELVRGQEAGDVAHDRRDVGDGGDPLVDVVVGGFAGQADPDRVEVQRRVVEVSLGVPLDEHRTAAGRPGESPLEAVAGEVDGQDALLAGLAPVAAAVGRPAERRHEPRRATPLRERLLLERGVGDRR
jgi:hypothetical protein